VTDSGLVESLVEEDANLLQNPPLESPLPAAVSPAAVSPAAVSPAAVSPAAVLPAAVSPAAVSPAAEESEPGEASYRAAFGGWLAGLGGQARELSRLLEREDGPEALRRFGAETLNQLLYAADLIPEGIEDLGYLETLFAFRVLAREACAAEPDLPGADPGGTLARLAAEAGLIQSFLGADEYVRLGAFVRDQRERRARGRATTELLESAEARAAAVGEAQSWADAYQPPSFGSGSHDLERLLSFLRTRLRRPSSPQRAGSA
jgi:hypothetical protein